MGVFRDFGVFFFGLHKRSPLNMAPNQGLFVAARNGCKDDIWEVLVALGLLDWADLRAVVIGIAHCGCKVSSSVALLIGCQILKVPRQPPLNELQISGHPRSPEAGHNFGYF